MLHAWATVQCSTYEQHVMFYTSIIMCSGCRQVEERLNAFIYLQVSPIFLVSALFSFERIRSFLNMQSVLCALTKYKTVLLMKKTYKRQWRHPQTGHS